MRNSKIEYNRGSYEHLVQWVRWTTGWVSVCVYVGWVCPIFQPFWPVGRQGRLAQVEQRWSFLPNVCSRLVSTALAGFQSPTRIGPLGSPAWDLPLALGIYLAVELRLNTIGWGLDYRLGA